MIEKYIKQLLLEYDCVIVPGFGAFLTQYISAEIHPITHKFTPPSKRVAFNEQLKSNDGLLINAVAEGENVSKETAQGLIQGFLKNIQEQFSRINLYELNDIGRFFYNTHDRLEFEPDTTVNYYEESYGLPELFFKPIERNFTSMNKPSTTVKKPANVGADHRPAAPSKNNSNVGLIVFTIVFLILAGATGFFYLNKDNENLASINPFVLLGGGNQEAIIEEETTQPETPAAEETQPVDEYDTMKEPEEEITSETGRFYVVAGSFKNRENAMSMKERFESENQSASILEPDGAKEYYRVAIADFDTKEEAISRLGELKQNYGSSIWVLSY